MSEQYIPGEPGVRAARKAEQRIVFRQRSEQFLAGGRHIDGAKSRDPGNTGDVDILRPGLLMGKITTGSLYAPAVIGDIANAEVVGSVALELSAVEATELNRRIGASGTFKLVGPPAASGLVAIETVTYSAVNVTTGVVTVTALVNAFVAGSLVMPTDGSENINSFIPDGWGTQVTDVDHTTNLQVEFPRLPIWGVVIASQLLPWPADDSTRRWIIGQLNQQTGGQFVFDFSGRY